MTMQRGPRWLSAACALSLSLLAGAANAATEVAPSNVYPQASTSAETSHVVAGRPSILHGASVTTGSVGGYFMILNATSDPGNGAVTPFKCVAVGPDQTVALSPDPTTAWAFSLGIVLVFSTTGCFTETQSATAFFSWQ